MNEYWWWLMVADSFKFFTILPFVIRSGRTVEGPVAGESGGELLEVLRRVGEVLTGQRGHYLGTELATEVEGDEADEPRSY